jgi:hypothetical protein
MNGHVALAGAREGSAIHPRFQHHLDALVLLVLEDVEKLMEPCGELIEFERGAG